MILKNARFLITQNSKREIFENKDVLVENSRIEEVGRNLSKEGEVIDCSKKIVMPGLINSHTHIPMNLFRGISDNKKLQNWLEEDIFPAEAKLEAEDVYYGSLHAIIEMIKTGTTCFNDMYFFEDKVAKASQELGIRGMLSRAVMDIDGKGEKRLKESKDFLEDYQDHKTITPTVGPHSVYTSSKEYLKKVKEQAEKFKAPIHVHISETEKENKDCLEKHDKTPTEYLNQLGILGKSTIGAHGVWLSERDVEILKEKRTGIAHCPCSNMKLGSGIARIQEMNNLKLGIGTDGAASNNNLNMFEEAKFASLLQKLDDPRKMNQQKVLDLLTIKGAELLGMENKIGSIEQGKKADMIAIDLDKISLSPYYNKKGLVSNLIFSFNGEVDNVIVNGEFTLKDGNLERVNEKEVIEKVQKRKDKFKS